MVDRYTKVCLTVIAVSLAVIGLRGLPMVGPAHADLNNYLEPVGTYQLAGLGENDVAVLNTRSGLVSTCCWDTIKSIGCCYSKPADKHRWR